MDLSVAVYFLNEAENDEVVQISRRELRDRFNVMELPTNQFIANFRVSKDVFLFLLEKCNIQKVKSHKSTNIRQDVKLATFLRFLATGSYQQTVGNEMLSSTSTTTVCRIVAEYLNLFENHICSDYIKMVSPEDEKNQKRDFFQSTGFPGIIGCVDGTHVRIKSPGDHLKHLYYNRKGYYSINVMVVCDNKTYIRYVDARHPGANHDAFVWEQSLVDLKLRNSFENGQKNTWILGDGGYKLKPYLMTPYRNPESAAEKVYNKKHASARNVVERCFGILKNRFRSIIGSRGLHYSPIKTTQIINACCALHNICLLYKCPEPTIELEDESNSEGLDISEEEEEMDAKAIRRNIAINL